MLDRAAGDADNRKLREYSDHAQHIAKRFTDAATGYGEGRADDRAKGYVTAARKALELKQAIDDATAAG